ncbi:MAG: hypothetical protein JXA66_03570 [Oligoflexia bacterium]|nr:hypothetical protein [Oligoflexia bacterium]
MIILILINMMLPLVSAKEQPVLDMSVLENSIEYKRRFNIFVGFNSSIGERIMSSNTLAPKTGYTAGMGFELIRDKFLWEFYTSYIPKSRFYEGIYTSVRDIGVNFKGRLSYSRFSSLYAGIGMLSRSELEKYFSYSVGAGVDVFPLPYFYVSLGFIFKSSFKKFTFPDSVYSKSFELGLRTVYCL